MHPRRSTAAGLRVPASRRSQAASQATAESRPHPVGTGPPARLPSRPRTHGCARPLPERPDQLSAARLVVGWLFFPGYFFGSWSLACGVLFLRRQSISLCCAPPDVQLFSIVILIKV